MVGDLIFISFPNYLPHDFKYLNNDNIGNDSYVLNPMIFRFIQKDVNKKDYLHNNKRYKNLLF